MQPIVPAAGRGHARLTPRAPTRTEPATRTPDPPTRIRACSRKDLTPTARCTAKVLLCQHAGSAYAILTWTLEAVQLLLLEASVRNWCSTLLFEAAAFRSCCWKKLRFKAAASGRSCRWRQLQHQQQLLFEAADCSCFSNLMFEAAVGSCGSKLLRFEAAPFGSSCCFEQLLLEATATAADAAAVLLFEAADVCS